VCEHDEYVHEWNGEHMIVLVCEHDCESVKHDECVVSFEFVSLETWLLLSNDVSGFPIIVASNLLVLLLLLYSSVVELGLIVYPSYILHKEGQILIISWSSSSSSEIVGVALKVRIFFFWGAFSSLAFLLISWVF